MGTKVAADSVMAASDHQGRRGRIRVNRGELDELLEPTSTPRERVRALLGVGVHVSDIARATGVSESTVRNWSAGDASPRPDAAITLDDLRDAARTLLEADIEPDRVAQWLTSRNRDRLEGQRPIELIHKRPMTVLAAAQERALEEEGVLAPS